MQCLSESCEGSNLFLESVRVAIQVTQLHRSAKTMAFKQIRTTTINANALHITLTPELSNHVADDQTGPNLVIEYNLELSMSVGDDCTASRINKHKEACKRDF